MNGSEHSEKPAYPLEAVREVEDGKPAVVFQVQAVGIHHSHVQEYMPKKPIKRGFKIWCLCDANGGYLQQFQIYTGTHCKIEIAL